MKVNTVWNYSSDTEADRLIQCASNTFNRFYLKNNFLVLPYLYANGNSSSTVYLPDLNYTRYPAYIKKVKKINPASIPVSDDKTLIKTASDLVNKSGIEFDKVKIKSLQDEWAKKEKIFFDFLEQTFPQLKCLSLYLEIRPTNIGTTSSFNNPIKTKTGVNMTIYIRIDQAACQLAEAVLSSLYYGWIVQDRQYPDWYANWQENEAVIDFLMTKTHLKDLFPDYQPTLINLRQKQLGKLVLESQKYLKKLGVACGDIFSLKNDRVLVDQKYSLTGLTEKEYRLLKFLIENKNQICRVDAIGDILWQDKNGNDFSLWAIAKQIERLRQKFQMHGLSPSLIQSQRGQGYLLRD